MGRFDLIEVTTWAGLTVHIILLLSISQSFSINNDVN